jgi:hypothetical protein
MYSLKDRQTVGNRGYGVEHRGCGMDWRGYGVEQRGTL